MSTKAVGRFIPVYEPWIGAGELERVTRCVKSGWISSIGAEIHEFEKRFATLCRRTPLAPTDDVSLKGAYLRNSHSADARPVLHLLEKDPANSVRRTVRALLAKIDSTPRVSA